MVKNITLDEDAHSKLTETKERMKEKGIEAPSLSDAVRWLWRKDNEG